MKSLKVLGAMAIAALAAACGGSSTSNPPAAPPDAGNPAGTVLVDFRVDDTANKVYVAANAATQGLDWKGGFKVNVPDGGVAGDVVPVIADGSWGGPYAKLYDDGPWSAGGHEPLLTATGAPSVAGDHIWGTTVYVATPATGSVTYEYGLNDHFYDTAYGNGWIWPGTSNGTFVVTSTSTGTIDASGAVLPAFGTVDMKIVLDPAHLGAGFTISNSTTVNIKGSALAWGIPTTPITVGSDGKYTFVLSALAGTAAFPHSGLLKSGNKPEFNWLINNVEYKDTNLNCYTTGVTAFTGPSGAATTPATVGLYDKLATPTAGSGNTYITIP